MTSAETETREREIRFDPNEGAPPFPWNEGDKEDEEEETTWEAEEELLEDDEPEPGEMDIVEFIEFYREAIARTVTQSYAPKYQPNLPEHSRPLPELIRPPIGAQEHALRGATLSLLANRGTVLVGEMGTGKTYIGAASAHMAGLRNILVLAPPHLIQKWKREVEMTVPGARATIVRTITDLRKLKEQQLPIGPRFTIMSREAAKLSYWWEPAYITRQKVKQSDALIHCRACGQQILDQDGRAYQTPEDISKQRPHCRGCNSQLADNWVKRINPDPRRNAICCPGCFQQVVDKDGIPLSLKALTKKRLKCDICGKPLWQPKLMKHKSKCRCLKCSGLPGGPAQYKNRRYALADYIKKRVQDFFDLLIVDEVHEYKGRGTAQGIAAGNLAQICGKVLTLTGTLTGGYSSTLFYLLYRFTPEIREEFKHNEQSRWIDRYGFRQRKFRTKGGEDDDPYEHGRGSGRRGYKTKEKETPGIAPAALFHIIGNTVFLRLHDVTTKLPPYQEQIMVQELSTEQDPDTLYSQDNAYDELQKEMRLAMQEALQQGSPRLMAAYLQSLLAYPDGCTLGETVEDPETGGTIVDIPPLSPERKYPKEKALIDLVREEKAEGRRVLVYATHTDTRDITPRIEHFLNQEGFKTAVLKSESVKSEKREEWVDRKVEENIDVLICNPRLVQTGLDLVDFPTICWYETDYSVYTMRQASRRSWRIGQDRPVRVVFMVYEDTIQTQALRLVARKMQSSLAVEGELPEEGLTTFGDDGQDIIMTLAKQIINKESFQGGGSLENIFARAREVEQESERYLVDDTWEAKPETPETPAEPEPREEPEHELEPQPVGAGAPTVLSWSEFMAEPEQPTRRRGRKAAAKPPSLFQWAVEQEAEQQRQEG